MGLDTDITRRTIRHNSRGHDEVVAEADFAYYRKNWFWVRHFGCENCEDHILTREEIEKTIEELRQIIKDKLVDHDEISLWFDETISSEDILKDYLPSYIDTLNKALYMMDSDSFDPKTDQIIIHNWW